MKTKPRHILNVVVHATYKVQHTCAIFIKGKFMFGTYWGKQRPAKQNIAYDWFRQQPLSIRAKQALAIASAVSHASEGNPWGVLRSIAALPNERRPYKRRRRSRQQRRSSSSRRRTTSKTSKTGSTNKHNTRKRYRNNLGIYHGSHEKKRYHIWRKVRSQRSGARYARYKARYRNVGDKWAPRFKQRYHRGFWT